MVLVSACISLVFSIIATYLSIKVARIWGIVDVPGELKIHQSIIPRFGGLGIVSAVFLTLVIIEAASNFLQLSGIVILVGSLLIALTGAVDDIFKLRPLQKILGQVLGSAVFAIYWLVTSGFKPEIALPAAFIAVILFICFMSNSLNLLDGLDGLAAGVTVILSIYLAILAIREGEQQLYILLGVLSGACVGFLVFNLPPAKTFMGDIGSLFLGYIVGVTAIELAASGGISVNKVLGVMLILGVPVGDTLLAIWRRFKTHRPLFSGDRLHLYDCLYQYLRGNTWQTLLFMWGTTAVTGLTGLFVFYSDNIVIGFSVASVIAFSILILAKRLGATGGEILQSSIGKKTHLSG
ncbi:MAG: glycosyltransferase family 4 protein [Moorellaceae bacterium]